MLLGRGIPLGWDDVSEGAPAISLFYSPWTQEQREMIRLLIEENEMECMAE